MKEENESKDWWRETSSEVQDSIEEGIRDANLGNLKPQSEARKVYAKYKASDKN